MVEEAAAALADCRILAVETGAAMHSFGGTMLTAEELAQFGEEYIAFLSRWHREPGQASPGSRHVSVVFHAFPTPDRGHAS